MSKCVIGKPAPAWKGQAVLPGGEIKEISSEDYKGCVVRDEVEPGARAKAAKHGAG